VTISKTVEPGCIANTAASLRSRVHCLATIKLGAEKIRCSRTQIFTKKFKADAAAAAEIWSALPDSVFSASSI